MEENKTLNENEEEIELFKITLRNDKELKVDVYSQGDMRSILRTIGFCFYKVCKKCNLTPDDIFEGYEQESSDNSAGA